MTMVLFMPVENLFVSGPMVLSRLEPTFYGMHFFEIGLGMYWHVDILVALFGLLVIVLGFVMSNRIFGVFALAYLGGWFAAIVQFHKSGHRPLEFHGLESVDMELDPAMAIQVFIGTGLAAALLLIFFHEEKPY